MDGVTRPRAGQVLAANLRALREQQALSLSEVARRSGIAKGTLSQLESGAGNPTIETVFSLSNALQVPVSTLLNEPADASAVLVRAADREVLSGAAVDLRMLRRLDLSSALVEVYEQRVRPGDEQRSDGHPGLEHIVVTSGTLRVGTPGQRYDLGAGDYLCFSAHGPHSYVAVGGPVTSVLLLEYPSDVERAPILAHPVG